MKPPESKGREFLDQREGNVKLQINIKPRESKTVTQTKESRILSREEDRDPLYCKLSEINYKKKFNCLIKAEKEHHEGILRGKYVFDKL